MKCLRGHNLEEVSYYLGKNGRKRCKPCTLESNRHGLSKLFVVNAIPDPDNDCWVWQGIITPRGYGAAARTTAQRYVWQNIMGAIEKGLEIDHLCRNTLCVNPMHLEPVTRLENSKRKWENRATCKRGHPYKPNTGACTLCIKLVGASWKNYHLIKKGKEIVNSH